MVEKSIEVAVQTTMATVTAGVVVSWLPVIFGIPAAIYYSLRIYNEFIKRRNK